MTVVRLRHEETLYADIDLDEFIEDHDLDYRDYLRYEEVEPMEDTKEERIEFLKLCLYENSGDFYYIINKWGKNVDNTKDLHVRPIS